MMVVWVVVHVVFWLYVSILMNTVPSSSGLKPGVLRSASFIQGDENHQARGTGQSEPWG
jgi:hypothetical protein